ncbi:MAG: hypothetical protein K6A44_01685 [bacterium]|nr:hypothetical protein [bacterium]
MVLEICPTSDNRTPFYFMSGYRDDVLSPSVVAPTRHRRITCYSKMNRYPEQVGHIKTLMGERTAAPLKIFDIGVAQGQEPLTHINSAFEIAQHSGKKLSDVIDLTTVDILREPPKLPCEAAALPKPVLGHLEKVYSSGKSFWATPIETVTETLLKTGQKQDVILFNNVIQHMSPKNEPALFKFFEKLVDLVAPKGTFCFSCERSAIFRGQIPFDRVKKMLSVLKSKGFVKIAAGIFTRRV